jgi:hypothetical protein
MSKLGGGLLACDKSKAALTSTANVIAVVGISGLNTSSAATSMSHTSCFNSAHAATTYLVRKKHTRLEQD